MQLQSKNITKKLPEYKQVKALIKTAFPKNEQVPTCILNHMAKKKGGKFTAYFDGEFCGFSYTIRENNTVFVLFLAVAENLRSGGYGSKILADLRELYADCEIVLNVEPPVETAENYEQRIKRIAFYERNGYFNTHRYLFKGKEEFLVLATAPTFNESAYAKILHTLSFGLYDAVLRTK